MFLCHRLKSSIKYLWLALAAGALYNFGAGEARAQQNNHRQGREVIVGELIGRADPRELEIMTRNGRLAIFGSGNGKPFDVLNRDSQTVELRFKPFDAMQPDNPQRIIYKFYESERLLMSALILEQVDFAELESEVSAKEVSQSNQHIQPLPQFMKPNTVKLICYNNRNPILKSRNVRQALAYAVNHSDIIKKIIFGGKAHIAKGPFDEPSPLHNSRLESYKYNPKKAIQLLAASGWRDTDGDGVLDNKGVPFRIDLYYQKGMTLDEAISRQVLINLLEIKVRVTPVGLSKRDINDRLGSNNFDAVLMNYTFENSVESLVDFFSADGAKNYMRYESAKFERYLKWHAELSDSDRRKTLVKSMQAVVNEDQPVNFLYFKWLTHYMINVNKFANFRDTTRRETRGELKPFEEWTIKGLNQE